MSILSIIKELVARLFSSDPDESRRRGEMRKIHEQLADLRPPYYRPKQNLVLPGFAHALFNFHALLRPLAEIARATVASSDARISQRFFDFLIDSRLPAPEQERKRFFSYDGMAERTRNAVRPEDELETISREFESFMDSIEDLGSRAVDADLSEVDRFIELCRHDFERILGVFDPSASLEDPRYKPDFAPAPAEQVLPELIDFYCLVDGFFFSGQLKECVLRLLERRSRSPVDKGKRAKIDRLFAQLDKSLNDRLSPEILLALLRASKGEPYFAPSAPRDKREFLVSYRRRMTVQFEKDRERILREQQENVITSDIKSLFGEGDILVVEGYDEENDSYLRQESSEAFTWIKPLRIVKTFLAAVFDPILKEPLKRILVEGYFDNKNFQNNLANILFQCERCTGRIDEFQAQLLGNGRISILAMRRYMEEIRRGKDISAFLTRLVDAINGRAKEIVDDQTAMLAMLGDALGDLITDYRKSAPDLVTNIRALGAGRNKEIMGQVIQGREKILVLVKIMRNFTYVKTALPGALAHGSAAAAEAGAVGSAPAGQPAAASEDLPEAEPVDD